ncbi:MAG: EamA family transporter [Gammaproteobacteria bacterium]
MHWLPLTLLSAFCLATADTITKRYLSPYRADELVLVRFGVAGILLLPLVFLQPWPSPPLAFWGWMSALIPLEIISMWLYMKAIRESPLSLTLPYKGCRYLVIDFEHPCPKSTRLRDSY